MNILRCSLAASLLALTGNSLADTTEARCDIYPRGSDHASDSLACTFSQRQGAVTIRRSDGIEYDLRPVGDKPGNYKDQDDHAAYRQSGLGDQGLIFRLNEESVYVYWNTSSLQHAADEDNPTAPYSTANYDATTLLPCGPLGAPDKHCPAGILRMEDNQASIVVTGVDGQEFTINFMKDYVNATNREVEAELVEDTWTVDVNGAHTYRVPLAAIEGG